MAVYVVFVACLVDTARMLPSHTLEWDHHLSWAASLRLTESVFDVPAGGMQSADVLDMRTSWLTLYCIAV